MSGVRVVAVRLKVPSPPDSIPLFLGADVFASADPAVQSSRSLVVLDERARGTRFIQQPVRSIINAPETTGMGFWSLNPYVGCEFGCSYCYARYAHRYVAERAHDAGLVDDEGLADLRGANGWEAFEHRIFVKEKDAVLAALDRDLPRVRGSDAPLVIGTATDPYQPAERRFGITRAVLQRLSAERGLHIGLISKGPLVTRDLDLWLRVQERNRVTIHISLMSVDTAVVTRFEARSPMPHARLRALSRMTAAGLNAGLIVAPVLPGITDSRSSLRALLLAARNAGARFAHPAILRLYPQVRGVLLPVLEANNPELERRYRAAYGSRLDAPRQYVDQLGRRFNRIAREVGIPVDRMTGETRDRSDHARISQLDLWNRSKS